jgi:hypothetical protein
MLQHVRENAAGVFERLSKQTQALMSRLGESTMGNP